MRHLLRDPSRETRLGSAVTRVFVTRVRVYHIIVTAKSVPVSG